MSRTGRLHAVITVAAAVAACLTVTGSAVADAPTSFNCDASALRIALLGQATIEPVTANQGQAQCQNANGTLAQAPGGLPVPLIASAATALTQVTPDGQDAQAIGGVAGLGVGLPAAIQQVIAQAVTAAQGAIDQLPPSVTMITVPLVQPPIPIPGLPTSVTVNIGPALKALIGGLNSDLVDLNVATAFAQAKCVNGQPQLAGGAQLAALTVLGQVIPTDQATTQAVNVINTQSINASNIDLSKVVISPAITDPAILTIVQNALKPLLAAIPPISIPAQLAQVSLVPDEQTNANGRLTEHALHVFVSLLGQPLINAVLGEARVSNASVKCTTPAQTASALALACTKRKLTLIDVLTHGQHVDLLGAADKRLVGQRVSIYYLVGHRRVATAVVGSDGFFRATAPLPPRRERFTNFARYQAQDAAGEKSLDLKLHRRMVVTSIGLTGGKVVIRGRVIKPLASPAAPILIQRRVSCASTVTVMRVMPRADGTFTVTLDPPPHTQAAVYRAATQVRKVVTNPKRFPTFTLPREVEL